MNKFVEKVSYLMDIGARAAVAAIMLVTTLNVIMRLFGSSLPGSVEIIQYLNALAIGLALALCGFHGGHVAVTFLTDKFSSRGQHVTGIIMDLLMAGFLGVTAWHMFLYGYNMQQQGEVTMTLGLPAHPIVYLVTAGIAVYLLVVIGNLVKSIKGLLGADTGSALKSEDHISIDDLIS